jgi:hypothetical protein
MVFYIEDARVSWFDERGRYAVLGDYTITIPFAVPASRLACGDQAYAIEMHSLRALSDMVAVGRKPTFRSPHDGSLKKEEMQAIANNRVQELSTSPPLGQLRRGRAVATRRCFPACSAFRKTQCR